MMSGEAAGTYIAQCETYQPKISDVRAHIKDAGITLSHASSLCL